MPKKSRKKIGYRRKGRRQGSSKSLSPPSSLQVEVKIPPKSKGFRKLHKYTIILNMEDAKPIKGGYEFCIQKREYKNSTMELGLKDNAKLMISCPALNIERTNSLQKEEKQSKTSILRPPRTYGDHDKRVGKHAREILLGSYKERKHKVTKKENTTRDVFWGEF